MSNQELIKSLRMIPGFDHLPNTDLAVQAADALEAAQSVKLDREKVELLIIGRTASAAARAVCDAAERGELT